MQSLAHTPHIDQLTSAQAQTGREIGHSDDVHGGGLRLVLRYCEHRTLPRSPAVPLENAAERGNGAVNARLAAQAGTTYGYGYGADTSCLPKESLAPELRPLSLTFSPKDIVSILTRNAAVAVVKTCAPQKHRFLPAAGALRQYSDCL